MQALFENNNFIELADFEKTSKCEECLEGTEDPAYEALKCCSSSLEKNLECQKVRGIKELSSLF
jgi:hypothetical protein